MNIEVRTKCTIESKNSQAVTACQRGNFEVVERLINDGVSVDLIGDTGSLLCESVRGNHHEIVDLLIKGGASLNARSGDFLQPALLVGVQYQDLRMVKQLIVAGGDVNFVDTSGNVSVLEMAAALGRIELCVELIKNGADWLHVTEKRGSVLSQLFRIDDGSIFDLILSQKNCFTKSCQFGLTLVHWACHIGHVVFLKKAIEAGALIDAHDSTYRQTPLHWAMHADEAECVEYLLGVGANVSLTNHRGYTPIEHGIAMQHAHAVVRYLIARGHSPFDKFQDPASKKFKGRALESLFSGTPDALKTLRILRDSHRSRNAAEKIMGIFIKGEASVIDAVQQPSQRMLNRLDL